MESRIILWLSGILILGVGILLGIIVARFTGKKDAHIRELEEKLAQSRKEMEEYRTLVNEHFMKTSELVDQMTASYRAIFMHLANGAQALAGRPPEASLKIPEDEFFAIPRPPGMAMEEQEAMPEADREEVAPDTGEETKPEQSGLKTTGAAEEEAVMAEETEGEGTEAGKLQDEEGKTKTEQGGVEPETGIKDENT